MLGNEASAQEAWRDIKEGEELGLTAWANTTSRCSVSPDRIYSGRLCQCYYLPQHFLYFRPLPQTHGSLRPILGVVRATGLCGGQQLELLQQESLLSALRLAALVSSVMITLDALDEWYVII